MTTSKAVKHQDVPIPMLFKRGNLRLLRLLVAINAAGPEGIATYKLLHQLGSTNHSKAFIKRAEEEGLIERVAGESGHCGQFKPVYNKLTAKRKRVLQSPDASNRSITIVTRVLFLLFHTFIRK